MQQKHSLMSITIAVQNLGDIAYQNHLSRLRYADVNNVTGRTGIYGMGRNISLQVAVPLSLR
jgi:iron complex outermembrane receptor protein